MDVGWLATFSYVLAKEKYDVDVFLKSLKLILEDKKNLSKLNPRSAVVAFNINKVYERLELIK